MRRWLPHPLLAASLFVMWLMLTQSLSPGQILLGASVALLAAGSMAALRPERTRLAAPGAMLKLAGVVLVDIVRSNLAVAAIVLFRRRERVSGFIQVSLDLTDRHGLALLALIITATPGTLWVEYDRRRGTLLVHVLDLVDEDRWIQLIKFRYESLIMKIVGQ